MARDTITAVICLDHASLKGGLESVAFHSAIGLKQHGHRPIVFAATGPVAALLTEADIEVVCLNQLPLGHNPSRLSAAMQGLWNGAAAGALDSLLRRLPRDSTVVHVHGWASALSSSIAGPIARSGLPTVFTIHDYYQFCPNGGFYNYPSQHVCKLQPLSAACWMSHCDQRSYPRKIWRNLRLLTAQRISRLPQIFRDYVTISELQGQIVEPLMPDGVALHRIPNPVSVPDLGPRPNTQSADMIFVGRLSPEKGILHFAEAARRVGITATFIGEGPLASELSARYPEAKQLGWLDKVGVQEAMRASRALVFPSVWYEGQPLTVLEAKGLGLPVVVSDACAGRESVEDGVCGLWFKGGDVDDLARALRAMQDDKMVDLMSAAAYANYWAEPPTVEAHVRQLAQLYRTMLGRAHVGVPDRSRSGTATSARAREPAFHA